MLNKLLQSAAVLSALFLLVACTASKKNHQARLLLKGADSLNGSGFIYPELTIQKGDLLTILVFSDEQEATALFNQPQNGGTGGSTSGITSGAALIATGRGYKVDQNGQIYVQSVGLMDAAGLSRNELADSIKSRLKTYLVNPYITVRYANARVTVLGDVLRPGVLDMPDQKMSVLDAIGLSGDLTPFARRDNVTIVREENGKRTVGHIDIGNASAYTSPYFFLQQNDLVYIEPTRKKPTGNDQVLLRNVAIGTSLLSVVTLVITLITR